MKILLAVCLVVIGVTILIFAVMARGELRTAAMSPVTAQDMPLTKIVGPELFREAPAGEVPPKPAEIASGIMNKIYCIGLAGLLALIGGAAVLLVSGKSGEPAP